MRRLSAAQPLALAFLALLAATGARAACDVSANGLAFGRVDLVRGTTTTGTISVTCDTPVLFQVALASGNDGANRVMRSPQGGELRYDLFSQPNLLIPWGDGARLGPSVFARSNGVAANNLAMYGRIFPQQAEPGEYSDQIIIEVMF